MIRDLFVRSKANPIIKPSDLPFSVNGVLNPGVAVVNGEVVLLLRIENRRGARMASTDGVSSDRRSWSQGWPSIRTRSGAAKIHV